MDHAAPTTPASREALIDLIDRRIVKVPFLVGVAGPVSVGKTTIVSAIAPALEARGRTVRVLSTDAFLLSTKVLNERGLMMRKGFPESYDHDEIAATLRRLRAGSPAVVNVYSHDVYDVLPGVRDTIAGADVVLIEGIVALQQPIVGQLDLAVYIDAPERVVREWYVDRFIKLVEAGKRDSGSFYHRFADIPLPQVRQMAEATWEGVNSPNLREHIAPSAANADVVVVKAADHSLTELRVVARR